MCEGKCRGKANPTRYELVVFQWSTWKHDQKHDQYIIISKHCEIKHFKQIFQNIVKAHHMSAHYKVHMI